MRTGIRVLLILFSAITVASCEPADQVVPRVVATVPGNGDMSVDPDTQQMTVTFNEAMTDGSWSWAYTEKSSFPDITGQAHYTEGYTVNILPVSLKPATSYEVWINSATHQGFKDAAGNAAVPYKLTFRTR